MARITSRDRTRQRLAQGVIRKRVSKGVFVDLDISPLYLAVADGLAEVGAQTIELAARHAPDDPATPESRIREAGQFGVIAFGQVVTVEGMPRGWRKPRAFRPSPEGVDVVATFRTPLHHLHEGGTRYMRARPYLGPARVVVMARAPSIIAARMRGST